MTTRNGRLVLATLWVAALSLIAIELALRAASFGRPRLADPCTSKAGPPGGGLNGAVERFARDLGRRRVRAPHNARGTCPLVRSSGRHDPRSAGASRRSTGRCGPV
jgi:hypothetical protein